MTRRQCDSQLSALVASALVILGCGSAATDSGYTGRDAGYDATNDGMGCGTCSLVDNATQMACEVNRCIVSRCATGYEVSADQQRCVPTVNATWDLDTYFKASNAHPRSQFGYSVALSADGNTLAVGAFEESSSSVGINSIPNVVDPYNGSGAVYVFVREDTGWIQQAYIKASNADTEHRFGRALALSADGNTLAVGAAEESSSGTGVNSVPNEGASQSGAVYVFVRTGINWTEQAFLKASNTGAGDFFGWSVSLSSDGNTLAVGADLEDSSATGINGTPNENLESAGAVYVFARAAGAWRQQAYIKARNAGSGDAFGSSVSLSSDGNTLAVGARFEDSSTTGINSTPNERAEHSGAVYIFSRVDGTWRQDAYLKASNTGQSNWFGAAVSLSATGDTLAVGAWGEASDTTGVDSTANEAAPRSGAVYLFHRVDGLWTQQAYLKASNTREGDMFGVSVSLSQDGNTLAIGAQGEDSSELGRGTDDSVTDSGATFVFVRANNTWREQAILKVSSADAYDNFGVSVSVSENGSVLAVGAYREASSSTGINSTPNNEAMNAGAVYSYGRAQ